MGSREPDHRIEANRRRWDERVPIHLASDFYGVDDFRSGGSSLRDFELEELGPVDGLDLVHLQCHFGQDTISWARQGARVWGLDFSQPAIDAATELAAADPSVEATFVCADVYDAVAALGNRAFDVVYTGFGAINWLPDLDRWAEVVHALLRPGGRLYLAEFHPVLDMFEDSLTVAWPYFGVPGGLHYDESGTYTDRQAATEHNEGWDWTHPLGEVLSVLLARGLHLDSFHEHDHTLFPRFDFLEERTPGRWHVPEGTPSLPFMYSLRMTKPA